MPVIIQFSKVEEEVESVVKKDEKISSTYK